MELIEVLKVRLSAITLLVEAEVPTILGTADSHYVSALSKAAAHLPHRQHPTSKLPVSVQRN